MDAEPRIDLAPAVPSKGLKYDFHSAAFYSDPYPHYDRMRIEDPVWRNPISGHWVLTRYEDVHHVLTSPDASNRRLDELAARIPREEREFASPLLSVLRDRLLFVDGEPHQRLRRLLLHGLSATAVSELRPVVESVVAQAFDELDPTRPIDLVSELTDHIPGRVILHVLGFPDSEQPAMKAWTDRVYAWMGTAPGTIQERTTGAVLAVERLQEAILRQVDEVRRSPRNDLLSALVHAEDDEHVLSDAELVANVLGLINAGQETTTCLLANGALALMRFPEQRALLRAGPRWLGGAVEEFLRFESPAQFIVRQIERPMRVGEVELEPGSFASLGLAAANRDPAASARPDRLDVTRDPAQPPSHLAFGAGPHFCIGARLARLEALVFFREWLRRFPQAELAVQPGAIEWRHTVSFRSPVRLPVVLGEPCTAEGV